MRTEFIAAFTAPTELAQQCDAHMTGARQGQHPDEANNPIAVFNGIWTESGLCRVDAANLVVLWTTTHPVPLPAAQAQPQPQQQPAVPPPPPPLPRPTSSPPRLQLI